MEFLFRPENPVRGGSLLLSRGRSLWDNKLLAEALASGQGCIDLLLGNGKLVAFDFFFGGRYVSAQVPNSVCLQETVNIVRRPTPLSDGMVFLLIHIAFKIMVTIVIRAVPEPDHAEVVDRNLGVALH